MDNKLQTPLLPPPAGSEGGGEDGHGSSKWLESILSDELVPWARRMLAATTVEMRMLVRLAAPAVLVYMINYLLSMSTQIFTGHLGTLELAVASLGNTRTRPGFQPIISILHPTLRPCLCVV
ncbi:protein DETOXIFICATION 40 [Hordeum vulgare]|nr:protein DETOXIFICATION 40 [Hordeum vulgare]